MRRRLQKNTLELLLCDIAVQKAHGTVFYWHSLFNSLDVSFPFARTSCDLIRLKPVHKVVKTNLKFLRWSEKLYILLSLYISFDQKEIIPILLFE